MTRRVLSALAPVLAAAACLAETAAAEAGTQDQSQTSTGHAQTFGGSGYSYLAQTFTAGRTGWLDRVDVVIDRDCPNTADLQVEVRAVSADGQPTTDVIATAQVPAGLVPYLPESLPIRLDPSVEVTAGTKYAIVLLDSQSYCERDNPVPGFPPIQETAYRWSGATGAGLGDPRFQTSPYARGDGWRSFDGTSWEAVENFDFMFITYVVDAPPPAPGSPDTGQGGARQDRPLTLDLTARKKQEGERLRFSASCSTPCTLSAQATGKADGDRFASKTATLPESTASVVKLKFSKAVRRKVADARGKATITATATDAGGRTATDSLAVKLRP